MLKDMTVKIEDDGKCKSNSFTLTINVSIKASLESLTCTQYVDTDTIIYTDYFGSKKEAERVAILAMEEISSLFKGI